MLINLKDMPKKSKRNNAIEDLKLMVFLAEDKEQLFEITKELLVALVTSGEIPNRSHLPTSTVSAKAKRGPKPGFKRKAEKKPGPKAKAPRLKPGPKPKMKK